MGQRVRITDVSPRDGLQNEPGAIATSEKLRLIELVRASGVDEVEVTSFVSPAWVPQLADAADVILGLARNEADRRRGSIGEKPLHTGGPTLSALVPNEKGLAAALAADRRARAQHPTAGGRVLSKVAVFTAASETFSHRNVNAGIAESIKRIEPVVAAAKAEGLAVRGYISCAIECPFEGPIPPEKVAQVAQALFDLGVEELDLGDTTGAAEAETINFLLHALIGRLGDRALEISTLHLHDTRGHAADCVREALQLGIRSFDGSVAGIGGCPYASKDGRRAPGNIATETLVRTVHDAGYATGVDLRALTDAALFARQIIAGIPAVDPMP